MHGYEGPKDVCVVVGRGGKNLPVPGRGRTRAVEPKNSPTTEAEGFNNVPHSKERPPSMVPDHVDVVTKLQVAKSGRTNHRVTEEIVAPRAARINEREAPHMPRAML